jgi:fucose permease
VLAGGIVGGIVGPELTKWSRTWLSTLFAGSYLSLAVFALAWLLIVQLIRLPAAAVGSAAAQQAAPRSLWAIVRQPTCWVAIATAALGYGVMNLLMVATPLAMQVCGHPWNFTAMVLEWHVIGMFAPGLVTGAIIARVGVLAVILTGNVLMLACVVIATAGTEVSHFLVALILLGVGWNFLYTGGTTLLTTVYRAQEKNKVQGFMDACVFATMITSSASSGALMHVRGWWVLNLLSVLPVALTAGLALWLATTGHWRLGRSALKA